MILTMSAKIDIGKVPTLSTVSPTVHEWTVNSVKYASILNTIITVTLD